MDRPTVPPAVADRWRELLDDAETTAEGYRADGYRTLVVHPGDVTPLSGTPFGLDVVAPPDEYGTLEALVDDAAFEASDVYRTEVDDVRLLIIVVEGATGGDATDAAVVVPAFLPVDAGDDLAARAREEGVMYTHVRPPAEDARVTFTHDDPELFL